MAEKQPNSSHEQYSAHDAIIFALCQLDYAQPESKEEFTCVIDDEQAAKYNYDFLSVQVMKGGCVRLVCGYRIDDDKIRFDDFVYDLNDRIWDGASTVMTDNETTRELESLVDELENKIDELQEGVEVAYGGMLNTLRKVDVFKEFFEQYDQNNDTIESGLTELYNGKGKFSKEQEEKLKALEDENELQLFNLFEVVAKDEQKFAAALKTYREALTELQILSGELESVEQRLDEERNEGTIEPNELSLDRFVQLLDIAATLKTSPLE